MKIQRNTVQKELIFDAMNRIQCHPTVETVYEEVSRHIPNISKATVYRNLSQMAEEGRLYRVCIPNGADHFDHRTDKHYHILCNVCGCVEDVPMDYMCSLESSLKQNMPDYEVYSHMVVFNGVCPKCKKNN